MPTTIALVGNPNSGKTTLFNQLTGSHQYVGNWPGVTVEKKEGTLKGDHSVRIVDLPGIYSLSPYTNEEVISRDFLAGGSVDAILNIVDATNLERNLFLTEQLMEFGVPVVVALNQMDIVEKRGYTIHSRQLSFEPSVAATGDIVCPAPTEIASGTEYPIINTPEPQNMASVSFISGFPPG